MKALILTTLFMILFSTCITAQITDNTMDKIIVVTASLNCTKEEAFEQFVSNNQLELWLTTKADVEPREGGKYELFWDPNDLENNSTIGCKILAIHPPNYLNFEWKGPEEYKHVMNNIRPLTNVTVIFNEQDDKTIVTLIHTGWKNLHEWEEARQYFIIAWKEAFTQLERKVNGLK